MNDKKNCFTTVKKVDSNTSLVNYHLFPNDNVSADVYNELVDLYYSISGITLEQLMQILRSNKHLTLGCIVYREFRND